MTTTWVAESERGSARSVAFMVWVALKAGRRAARALLYPICLYYYVMSPRSRRASCDYLARVLGRTPSALDVLRHYHAFAATVVDRIFLVADQSDAFDISIEGVEAVERALAEEHGCVLLGSHLGSFEVLRTLGRHTQRPVNIVMTRMNAEKTGRALARLAPHLEARVIEPSRPDAMLRIKECLDRGEIVGILGDRALASSRTAAHVFLGEKAHFPLGPLLLGAMLGSPIVLFFGLYRGGRRYEVHFEALTEGVAVERSRRETVIAAWQARYVSRLEHYARLAPYNWFNFYDFWDTRSH